MKNLITQWENLYGSTLLIIHDVEQESCYSIESSRDTSNFVKKVKSIAPDRSIDLILHTKGGSSTNSKIMIDALLNHTAPFRAYIPIEAYSAGTLIALAADELHMDALAHLSKIDTQMIVDRQLENSVPVGLMRSLKHLNEIHGRVANQFYNDDLQVLKAIFKKGNYDNYQQTQIINHLVDGPLSHGYPISYAEIKEMGLNVDNVIPPLIEKILNFSNQE